jgi:uncharacterized protein YjlB
MKIRIHNNDDTDYCDYEGTIEEILEQSRDRIKQEDWKNGWSETISETIED